MEQSDTAPVVQGSSPAVSVQGSNPAEADRIPVQRKQLIAAGRSLEPCRSAAFAAEHTKVPRIRELLSQRLRLRQRLRFRLEAQYTHQHMPLQCRRKLFETFFDSASDSLQLVAIAVTDLFVGIYLDKIACSLIEKN